MEDPLQQGIGTWNYYMPWSDLLEKLILDEMRYTYYNQFAEAIDLNPTNLSKIVNGKGRLGAPSKPKTLLKLIKGLILGEYPDHPPAIRSAPQLTTFLDAVAKKFWRGEYGYQAFRDTGRLWVEQSVEDAFARQRQLWPAGEEKQETVGEPMAAAPVALYYLTEEEFTLLVQGCTLIHSALKQILARYELPYQADN